MKVCILHSTAGEGHKKIAEAIEAELKSRKSINQIECFDAFERVPKFFADSYPKTYFYAVKWAPKFWGFLYEFTDLPQVYFFLKPLRHLWNWLFSKDLRNYLKETQPDVIVTTHFFSAQVCAAMKFKGMICANIITVITDVMPHSFWVNEGTDHYWVMANESKEDLVKRKVAERVVSVGGIPVNANFVKRLNRSELIHRLNLVENRFNILFTSGSFGIGPTEQWLAELENFKEKVQALVVCGRNQELYIRLVSRKFGFPVILMGFVHNMHELMSVSDLLVAKSGGSTTCESLVKSLPMLITSPIPGQETRNAKWLIHCKAAVALIKPGDLNAFMTQLTENNTAYKTLKANIERIAKPEAVLHFANYIESLKRD